MHNVVYYLQIIIGNYDWDANGTLSFGLSHSRMFGTNRNSDMAALVSRLGRYRVPYTFAPVPGSFPFTVTAGTSCQLQVGISRARLGKGERWDARGS